MSRFYYPIQWNYLGPGRCRVLPDWDTPNIVTIDHEECAMSSEDSEISTEALEDIAYLCRSANRVLILDALTEGPYSRRELANQTDASRTTLDRIVNELEERRWAERTTEGTYVATAHGKHLMRRFRPFIGSVEALQRLDEAITWLPIDELSVSLEHFRDAVVRRPESDDPVETIDFMNDLLGNASEFRVLAHLAPPEPLGETLHDQVVSGQMTMDGVITDNLFNYLCGSPERADRWRALIDAGTELHLHEGPIPCNLWIFDETILIKKSGPEPIDESYGVPIVSNNSAVRSWAHDLIDDRKDSARRIAAEGFAEDSIAY